MKTTKCREDSYILPSFVQSHQPPQTPLLKNTGHFPIICHYVYLWKRIWRECGVCVWYVQSPFWNSKRVRQHKELWLPITIGSAMQYTVKTGKGVYLLTILGITDRSPETLASAINSWNIILRAILRRKKRLNTFELQLLTGDRSRAVLRECVCVAAMPARPEIDHPVNQRAEVLNELAFLVSQAR